LSAERSRSPLCAGLCLCMSPAHAESLYTFEGTITGCFGSGYDPSVLASNLGVTLGVTPVTYVIDVDFDRNASSYTNSSGVWNYFYTDLLGQSFVSSILHGITPESNSGADVYYTSGEGVGDVEAGTSVSITADSFGTANWRVQDWSVGQQLRFQDGTLPEGGGFAAYVYGPATLTSITIIPEPSSFALLAVSLCVCVVVQTTRIASIKHPFL